jgi:hypothetical protein
MVNTLYQYSLASDFSGILNKKSIRATILESTLIGLVVISLQGDDVNIIFDPALSGGDETILNAIVTNTLVTDTVKLIDDIQIDTGLQDRDIIIYDAALGEWRNRNFDEVDVQKAVDRQCVSSAVEIATTSQSYIDMNTMAITANNLGTGNYIIMLDVETEEENSREWRVIITVDDVEEAGTERVTTGIRDIQHRNFMFRVTGIAHSSVVKVKWLTTAKTIRCSKRTLALIEI